MTSVRPAAPLLLESQRWPRERLDSWVEERLEALLAHSRTAPFWRDRVPANATLSDLPLLEREDLQRSLEAMRPPGRRVVTTATTSGSSGRPVTIERGPEAIRYAAAARLRQLSWWGLPPAELATANALTTVSAADPPVRQVSQDPPRFVVNAFRLGDAVSAAGHGAIVDAGGVALIGATTSVLEQWADAYTRSDQDAGELGTELAIVGGEITAPSQRQRIGAVFGCRTAEMYGAVEAVMIAAECPEGSLHLNEEVVHVEILNRDGTEAGAGDLGEVVVTPLHSHDLPLLRYRLGDAAAVLPGECACGLTLRRLDVQLGRLEDMLIHPDGSLMHPRCVQTALERVLATPMRAFHAVQVAPSRFVVYLDVERRDSLRALEEGVAAELGSFMRAPVSVELVLDEARARATLNGGKRRTFSRQMERR